MPWIAWQTFCSSTCRLNERSVCMDVTKAPPFDLTSNRAGDRLKSEAAALNADEVVGIKTYIIELGSSLVEIFAVGTAMRKMTDVGVQTANLPAQAIIRDKDTWLSGSGGFDLQSTRAGG